MRHVATGTRRRTVRRHVARLTSALAIAGALTTSAAAQADASSNALAAAAGSAATALPVPVPLTPDTNPAAHGTSGHVEDGCGGHAFGWIKARKHIRLRVRLTVAGTLSVRAGFRVRDVTAHGRVVSMPFSRSQARTGPASAAIGATLANGHIYRWHARELASGAASAWSVNCRFAIDTSPPRSLTISSSAFPPAGSTPTGVAGSVAFTAVDPVPARCAPVACSASGVARFEWSLDRKIPARGITKTTPTQGVVKASTAPPGGQATGTLASLTIATWGVHTLFVQAVDHAGNRSRQVRYGFYVPMNTAGVITPPVPGDINGDNVPDLIGTTSSGGLNLYPGSTSSTTFPAPVDATANNASPDSGNDWNTFLITHRSSLVQGPLDDLLVHKASVLYVYQNNPLHPGMAPQFGNTGQVVISNRPSCAPTADNKNNCAGYASTWANVSQMLAVGDPFPSATIDSPTSLVTVENGKLWFFPGQGASFSSPVLLGSSGWDGVTLIAPGYINGQITIWARDNATGTIHSYPITIDAKGLPTLDPAKPGTPVTATSGPSLPGISLPAATYPVLTSPGDAATRASLFAIDSAGKVWLFVGTSDASSPLPASGTQIGSVTAGSIEQLS